MHDPVREGLSRVWDSGGRTFVTFELAGNSDAWVQWIDGQLNLAWPRDDDPAQALPRLGVRLPPGAVISSFQPCGGMPGNAIVHAYDARIEDVSEFIHRWFSRVFDAPPRAQVEVRVDSA